MPPKVAVVIPTFNRQSLIKKALESVLGQTYQNFEIIVVDDASKDGTEEAVRSIKDPRIKYIRHAENQGGAAARNTGIQNSTSEFIAFLDSDDEWLSDKLEKQMAHFLKLDESFGLVYCGFSHVDENNHKLGQFTPSLRGYFTNDLLVQNCVGTFSTVVIRKTVLTTVNGLDAAMKSCQDWDLFIRLSKVCQFDYLPQPLVLYHVEGDPNRISGNATSIVRGHRLIEEKYAADYQRLPAAFMVQHCNRMSFIYASGGNLLLSLGQQWRAFQLSGNPAHLLKMIKRTVGFLKNKVSGRYGYLKK